LQGVRTKHDIDVLVKSHHAGFDITWIVECKQWASKVSKLHVLALREIVTDLGADRGILLAEKGFQSGAVEAAALTNVHITSLAELSKTARDEIFSLRLRELYDRVKVCKDEYWDIPKSKRIECGLRQEVGVPGYYGDWVIKLAEDLIAKGLRGSYPIKIDELFWLTAQHLPMELTSSQDLAMHVEDLIEDLEKRIANCKKN
jgi:restriction system protein